MFILDLLNVTLAAVGKAFFSFSFIVAIVIVYFIEKKKTALDVYNHRSTKEDIWLFFENIMHGLVAGIIVSGVIVFIGLPIELSMSLMIILPVSIILSYIHQRFICLSYSAAVVGLLSVILNGQTVLNTKLPLIQADVTGLLLIVGVLHLAEAILVFISGAKNPMVILTKKGNQVVQGHVLQKYWPIPFALLCMTAITDLGGDVVEMPLWWPLFINNKSIIENIGFFLLPFMGVVGYRSVTYAFEPVKKARRSALGLFIYSSALMGLAILSVHISQVTVVGLIFMPMFHEVMWWLEQVEENRRKPLYGVPENGVRVMIVEPHSKAAELGFKLGDIITEVNGIAVNSIPQFRQIYGENQLEFVFEIEDINNKRKTVIFKPDEKDKNIGMRLLPRQPKFMFKETK